MTITHVQVSTPADLTGGFATSATITAAWPAATTNGNLLLAVIHVNTTNATFTAPTPPAGWTKAVGGTDLSAAGEMGYVFYILNSPPRSGNEQFTMTNNSTNDATLQLFEVNIDNKTQALDKVAQASVSNAAATTAPNSGLTAAIAQGDEYIFGVIANRNVTVPTSPVMGGTATGGAVAQWTTDTSPNATAASDTTMTTYDRQTTGTGTIGMSGTLGTARGWNALVATFSLTAAAGAKSPAPAQERKNRRRVQIKL